MYMQYPLLCLQCPQMALSEGWLSLCAKHRYLTTASSLKLTW